jgi:hypothetical protein
MHTNFGKMFTGANPVAIGGYHNGIGQLGWQLRMVDIAPRVVCDRRLRRLSRGGRIGRGRIDRGGLLRAGSHCRRDCDRRRHGAGAALPVRRQACNEDRKGHRDEQDDE